MGNDIIWTTTNSVDGYHVEKYLGVISKEIVFRNGLISALGAAVTNFVSAFNFQDVELKGSSELIANAKEYLFRQFENEARRKGADAIIGIDFETTFGTDLVKVSINGTAVKLLGDTAASTDNDEARKKVSVKESNITDEFIIAGIELNPSFNQRVVSVNIIKKDGYEINDLICDVILQTRFGEKHTLENVYFLNFKGNGKKIVTSEPYPVDIPLAVYKTIESAVVIVKKAICNSQIIEFQTDNLSNVELIQKEEGLATEKKQTSVNEYYRGVDNCQTDDELNLYIMMASSILDSKSFSEFTEETGKAIAAEAGSVNSGYLKKTAIKRAFVNALNSTGGIDFILHEGSGIECPLCSAMQGETRKVCFRCGLKVKAEVL